MSTQRASLSRTHTIQSEPESDLSSQRKTLISLCQETPGGTGWLAPPAADRLVSKRQSPTLNCYLGSLWWGDKVGSFIWEARLRKRTYISLEGSRKVWLVWSRTPAKRLNDS